MSTGSKFGAALMLNTFQTSSIHLDPMIGIIFAETTEAPLDSVDFSYSILMFQALDKTPQDDVLARAELSNHRDGNLCLFGVAVYKLSRCGSLEFE